MTRAWRKHLEQASEWFAESRETPEGRRVLVIALLTLLAWGLGFVLLSWHGDLENRASLQASRFSSLVEVSRAYRALPLSQRQGGDGTTARDPLSAASDAVERLQMKSRLKSLSSSSRGISLSLEGLGQAEMLALARELELARLAVLSAEIRALPVGGKRLLSVNLLLGGTP
jgi:hypothetical protein